MDQNDVPDQTRRDEDRRIASLDAQGRTRHPSAHPSAFVPRGPPPIPLMEIRSRLQQASTRIELTPTATSAASADEANNECGICQDVLVESGDNAPVAIKFKVCKHALHEDCTVEWLDWVQRHQANGHVARAKCPTCRTHIFPILPNPMRNPRMPPHLRRPSQFRRLPLPTRHPNPSHHQVGESSTARPYIPPLAGAPPVRTYTREEFEALFQGAFGPPRSFRPGHHPGPSPSSHPPYAQSGSNEVEAPAQPSRQEIEEEMIRQGNLEDLGNEEVERIYQAYLEDVRRLEDESEDDDFNDDDLYSGYVSSGDVDEEGDDYHPSLLPGPEPEPDEGNNHEDGNGNGNGDGNGDGNDDGNLGNDDEYDELL